MVKNISILGSTGSIGTQTLEVVRYNKDIKVTALAAGSNVDLIEKQIREFKPEVACLWREEKAKEILLEKEIQILVDLNDGQYSATAWGCDLTYDYVRINGDYRS